MHSPALSDALPAALAPDGVAAAVAVSRELAAARFLRLAQDLRAKAQTRAEACVRDLFTRTDALQHRSRATGSSALLALRHTAMVPVSKDNAVLLTGDGGSEGIRQAVELLFDPFRYPWLGENRAPSAQELAVAQAVVTHSLATSLYETSLRKRYQQDQEHLLSPALSRAGFVHLPRQVRVASENDLRTLPVGSFLTAQKVRLNGVTFEADVLVRDQDEHWLIIEAKYSGSDTNGTKRLSRECGDKKAKVDRLGGWLSFLVLLGGCFSASDLDDYVAGGGAVIFDHLLDPDGALGRAPVSTPLEQDGLW